MYFQHNFLNYPGLPGDLVARHTAAVERQPAGGNIIS
jgi:hypothetical protein